MQWKLNLILQARKAQRSIDIWVFQSKIFQKIHPFTILIHSIQVHITHFQPVCTKFLYGVTRDLFDMRNQRTMESYLVILVRDENYSPQLKHSYLWEGYCGVHICAVPYDTKNGNRNRINPDLVLGKKAVEIRRNR